MYSSFVHLEYGAELMTDVYTVRGLYAYRSYARNLVIGIVHKSQSDLSVNNNLPTYRVSNLIFTM